MQAEITVLKIRKLPASPVARAGVFLGLLAFGSLDSGESAARKAEQERAGQEALSDSVKELYKGAFNALTCAPGKAFTLGLWTIPEEKSPVGLSATKRIYEEILARLLRHRPECASVIDSAGIGVIIDHLSKSGALEQAGGNVLSALTEAHQNVDMVVFPELFSQSGKVMITLRIVDRVSGKTLAQTAPAYLPSLLTQDQSADTAASLEQAVKAAARELVASAPNLQELQRGGIYFEGTGAQPPAGRYLLEQLTGALTEAGANPLSGKIIKVRGVSIEVAEPRKGSGVELDEKAIAKANNAYDLNGRYWVRGDALELNLTLTRPDGGMVGWRGKIRIADLKGLGLRPANPASLAQPLPKGNFAFQVTSPYGVSPTYKVGDELQLLIRAGQPAWLYCFYIDSKGQILPIFPVPSKLADERSNKLVANTLLKLPDPSEDSFRFRINADSLGEELVSCFAANRDIRRDLPDSLFPEQLTPVTFLTLEKLRELFRDIKNAQIAESLVTVTVTR